MDELFVSNIKELNKGASPIYLSYICIFTYCNFFAYLYFCANFFNEIFSKQISYFFPHFRGFFESIDISFPLFNLLITIVIPVKIRASIFVGEVEGGTEILVEPTNSLKLLLTILTDFTS